MQQATNLPKLASSVTENVESIKLSQVRYLLTCKQQRQYWHKVIWQNLN